MDKSFYATLSRESTQDYLDSFTKTSQITSSENIPKLSVLPSQCNRKSIKVDISSHLRKFSTSTTITYPSSYKRLYTIIHNKLVSFKLKKTPNDRIIRKLRYFTAFPEKIKSKQIRRGKTWKTCETPVKILYLTKKSPPKQVKNKNCGCKLVPQYVDMGKYIGGAFGTVNIGQCVGSCTGGFNGDCDESEHTIFKRMIMTSHGMTGELKNFGKSRRGTLKIDCVPTEFESLELPIKVGDNITVEKFTTLKAKSCGCR